MISVQGFVLIATLLYAAVEAMAAIREGGSDITAGWAIAYGVLTTIASLVVWVWLRSQSAGSDLLDAETTAWRIAALRGVGMTVGFTAILLLQGTALDDWAPYIDPAMVLATCVIFIVPPVRMVRGTLVELLEGAPAAEVEVPVRAAVDEVRGRFDLATPTVLVNQGGPQALRRGGGTGGAGGDRPPGGRGARGAAGAPGGPALRHLAQPGAEAARRRPPRVALVA